LSALDGGLSKLPRWIVIWAVAHRVALEGELRVFGQSSGARMVWCEQQLIRFIRRVKTDPLLAAAKQESKLETETS